MNPPANEILRQRVDTLADTMDKNAGAPMKAADVREIGANLALIGGRERLERLQTHMQTHRDLLEARRGVEPLSADDEALRQELQETLKKMNDRFAQELPDANN